MKKLFETPEMEVTKITPVDVIATSSCDGDCGEDCGWDSGGF